MLSILHWPHYMGHEHKLVKIYTITNLLVSIYVEVIVG